MNALRVLLIEDNLADAELLALWLDEAQVALSVEHVQLFAQACERWAQASFDALLLDLDIPDGFGLELLLKALRLAGSVPVVVLTGNLDAAVRARALQLGAAAYVLKGQAQVPALLHAVMSARRPQGGRLEVQVGWLPDPPGWTTLKRAALPHGQEHLKARSRAPDHGRRSLNNRKERHDMTDPSDGRQENEAENARLPDNVTEEFRDIMDEDLANVGEDQTTLGAAGGGVNDLPDELDDDGTPLEEQGDPAS